jgi:hypothetical protein
MRRSFIIFAIGILFQSCAATESHRQTINNEPMLIGTINQAELFREFPVFKKNYDGYTPKDSVILSLKDYTEKIHIEIFLGTWCGDSKRNAAYFLKTLDLAGRSNISYTIIALDRTKRDKEQLTVKYSISRVPTMVFMKNGKEIGRITEYPERSIEEDILSILGQ